MAFGIVPKLRDRVLNSYNWHPWIRKRMLADNGWFTIFHWCPWFKWAIVIANFKDMTVPAQNISAPQQLAVSLTGFVWSRYVTQIYPFSANLLAVNFFMGISGLVQIIRKV